MIITKVKTWLVVSPDLEHSDTMFSGSIPEGPNLLGKTVPFNKLHLLVGHDRKFIQK